MPTIGRIGSFDVIVFRNDHDPPHFHVFGGEFSGGMGTKAPSCAIVELGFGPRG
jgi:hypothetical protein